MLKSCLLLNFSINRQSPIDHYRDKKCWFHQKFKAINFNPKTCFSSYRQLLPFVLIQLIIFFTHTLVNHVEYRITLRRVMKRWVIFQLNRELPFYTRAETTELHKSIAMLPTWIFARKKRLQIHLIRSILVSLILRYFAPSRSLNSSYNTQTHHHLFRLHVVCSDV